MCLSLTRQHLCVYGVGPLKQVAFVGESRELSLINPGKIACSFFTLTAVSKKYDFFFKKTFYIWISYNNILKSKKYIEKLKNRLK